MSESCNANEVAEGGKHLVGLPSQDDLSQTDHKVSNSRCVG